MKKGEKEAKQGFKAEIELVNLFNSKLRIQLFDCLNQLGIKLPSNYKFKAELNKIRTAKSDILLTNSKFKIGISLKTIHSANFHQLDRRRLEDWKSILNMPNEVFLILKEGILSKAKNRQNYLVPLEKQPIISSFIKKNLTEILREVFKKNEEYLKILAIYFKNENKIYLINLDDLLKELNKVSIKFTKGGFNIGEFISIQRKGGNGKKIKIPKTDWNHPGNQVQFKLKPNKLIEFIQKNPKIRYCIIYIK